MSVTVVSPESPANQEDQVLITIRQIIRATDLYSRQLSKQVGLTAPQLLVLKAVGGLATVSISRLSAEVSLSQATVTTILDRLEARGLVARHRSTKDKRVVHATLTEAGQAKLNEAPTPLQDQFSKQFAALQDWEKSKFDRADANYLIAPDLARTGLTRRVLGHDESGQAVETSVVEERPLTIYLNAREIVTAMTIGDYPEYLALGFLANQGMLPPDEDVTGIDYDEELEVVVVRTANQTDHEAKLSRKTRTSGCAVGTVFGDMMAGLEGLSLPRAELRVSWLYALSHKINRTPSLYLEAGAIHGTVLCHQDTPLVYMEDVGRHNAVDKIAGWMRSTGARPEDKILYTTGRLTSEMVIKCALMGIPVLVSRSGFTAWGVEIARQVGLTLVGRLKGKRFVCLSGEERLLRDTTAPPVVTDGSERTR